MQNCYPAPTYRLASLPVERILLFMAVNRSTRSALALVGFLAATLAVGLLGGGIAAPAIADWYLTLAKPPLTPPGTIFAPVWTVLYLLMAVAAWLAWRTRSSSCRNSGLRLWWAQLVVNLAWTAVFFGLRAPGVALIDLLLLIAAIASLMRPFHTIRPLAAWLMVPYLAWCCFAMYLDAGIWWMNR